MRQLIRVMLVLFSVVSALAETPSPITPEVKTVGNIRGLSYPLIKDISSTITPSGPSLVFHVVPLYDSFNASRDFSRIDIFTADGKLFQQIAGPNPSYLQTYTNSLELVDDNKDGYLDIRLLSGTDKSGAYDRYKYTLFIFDPPEGKFIKRSSARGE